MATLREIRKKLHSVANVRKITQAMEVVAASHLRRAQAKAEMSRPYAVKLKEMLDSLILASDDLSHPLMNKRNVRKSGYVIIAADKGLCGSYNHAVFSRAEKTLKKSPQDQLELILVGRKAVDYFSGKKWKVRDTLSDWTEKITYKQIEEFAKKLIQMYLGGDLDEMWLIYTHFVSIASREVRIEKFLNIDYPKSEVKTDKVNTIFEPGAEQIMAELLPHYLITKVQSALNEAYASELAARIFSMRAATKNAGELIEKLMLVRNKVRQSGITRELIEISSGAENLK